MKHVTLISIFLISIMAFGQGPGGFKSERPKIGKLSGQIVDKENQSALAYTKIVLLRKKDSAVVTGGLSTENGTFIIEEIPAGFYTAKITSFGYKTFYKDSLLFFPKKPEQDLGVIQLEKDVDLLNEVEVCTKKRSCKFR